MVGHLHGAKAKAQECLDQRFGTMGAGTVGRRWEPNFQPRKLTDDQLRWRKGGDRAEAAAGVSKALDDEEEIGFDLDELELDGI